MAKVTDSITINAELRLDVSHETAMTCLNILQAYINGHNDKEIIGHNNPDGTIWYEIVSRRPD